MKLVFKTLFAVLCLGFVWTAWYLWPPNVLSLKSANPARTRLMDIRTAQAKAAGRPYKIHQTWVPLESISPHLRHAILVAEDARFYDHHGVDWDAMAYSLRQDIERRRFAFGGSTITQQVAKNLYLTPSKNIFRKIKELEIALLMERVLSKRRILEIYLNVIEWGDGVFGAEAASWRFFGKPASDLTPEEAAALAAVVPSPRRHSPTSMSPFTDRRKEWILKWMDRSGFLPAPEPMEVPVFSPPAELLNERSPQVPETDEEEESGDDAASRPGSPAGPEAAPVIGSTEPSSGAPVSVQ